MKRERRIGNRFLDGDRNRLRRNAVRADNRALEQRLRVAAHASCIERARGAVGRDDRARLAADERPHEFLRAPDPCTNRRARAFLHRDRRIFERELVARRDNWPDCGLHRLLILVLKLHPISRARDARDAHLVNVADEVVVPVPAADPER